MTSKHAWKIDFVPWDFNSEEHVARIYEQRIACGWRAEEVPDWVETAKKGTDNFYWAVLSDQVPDREALLAKHVQRYPKESAPLRDTAKVFCGKSLTPSNKQFHPIGHIALCIHAAEHEERLGLPPSGAVWIQRLYISYALQQGGFGIATMANAEKVAQLEPLNASIMALDTLRKEFHQSEKLLWAAYDLRGLPRPVTTNQEWYERQGYVVYTDVSDSYDLPYEGGSIKLEIVYLKKNLR